MPTLPQKKIIFFIQKLDLSKNFLYAVGMENKEIQDAIDFLTQANYNANRERGESPRRLALVYGEKKVQIMEKNFSKGLTIEQK